MICRQLQRAEKSFESLGQTARLSLVPMGDWSRELGAAARLAREAGPEVVLPLEAAGEFVKKTLVGAARSQAFHRQSFPLAA